MKSWFTFNPSPLWAPEGGEGGGGEGGGEGAGADKKPPAEGAAAAEGAADGAGGEGGEGAAAGAGKEGGEGEGGSFLGGADDLEEGKVTTPADFPEDWRDKMAGEDKELRKALDRYKSPADVAKANLAAQKRLRSGQVDLAEPMPDPEKEPDKAKDWRKARGIPDDPTGYEVPETVKAMVTDADKPRLAEFTEHMHKNNVPAPAAAAALEFYFQNIQATNEAIALADKADKGEVEEALRSEWGPEFKANSTVAKRFAEEAVPGINWFEARLPDGRLLGSVPDFVKALADMGRERYGDVSFAGQEATARTTARKEEIERIMVEDHARYENDPKMRQEYREIIEAEERRTNRSSGHTPRQ